MTKSNDKPSVKPETKDNKCVQCGCDIKTGTDFLCPKCEPNRSMYEWKGDSDGTVGCD